MRYFLCIVLFCVSSTSFGISQDYIDKSIKKAAKKVGVPYKLLDAVCYAESRHTPNAYVFSDGGTITNHAFGMCQVLYNTAGEYGFVDDRCAGDFRYRKFQRNYKNCKLFGPYTNAYYAAKYLKKQLKRYNGSWINAIAAYNSGSVRICKTGWVYRNYKDAKGKWRKTKLYKCEKGGLLNQRYVDRVLHAFLERSKQDDGSGLSEIQEIADTEEKQKALIRHVTELGKTREDKGISE